MEVADDIEAYCGRCKGNTWHVIVAMVGRKVAQVRCKQCDALHGYRGPNAHRAKNAKKKETQNAGSGIKGAVATMPLSGNGMPASNEPLVSANPDRPVRAYRIDQSFVVGDRIEHKTFGTGVVELDLGPGKVQVYFPTGRRVLAHQRT